MRRYARFHVLVFCMAVLALSLPFATYAQQNSVPVAAETAAAQDANAMRLEAKVAAERDASNDINRLSWFNAGVGTFAAGCLGGIVGMLGMLVGDSIASRDSSDAVIVGGCVGCAVGLILPIRAIYKYQSPPPSQSTPIPMDVYDLIYKYQSPPPSERLIGKSPEYVEFYTHVYMAKSRSLRIKWAAVGAAVGPAAPVLILGPLY